MTKTVEAIYEDGVLKLQEPVDLHRKTRVRVIIEIPEVPEPLKEASSWASKEILDAPESSSHEDVPDRRDLRLSPERRALFRKLKHLQHKIGSIDLDVVESLRDFRENG